MAKTFTAQEMREMADEFYNETICTTAAAMLRQAADAMEREKRIREEINEIDTMEVAPLDGHPMHQHTNTKKVAAILEFFPKVKGILDEVNPQEHEERRNESKLTKSYWCYGVKTKDGSITHFGSIGTANDFARSNEDCVVIRSKCTATTHYVYDEWEEVK